MVLTIVITGFFARSADAQPVFSVAWQGPPKGLPSGFGPPITEGDLLVPGTPTFAPMFGPMPPPVIVVPGGFGPPGLALPAYPGAVGLPAGVPGFVEVDAVSFGTDLLLRPGMPATSLIWAFSVDEFSIGIAGPIAPNVFTMGPAGAGEASADIFVDVGTGAGPFCGLAPGAGNTTLLDCNGVAPPAGFPGIMGPAPIVEPNFPIAGVPDMGADIDALDLDPPPGPPVMPAPAPGVAFPIYFSLDSGIFNAAEGVPNSGSAAVNGPFTGADILVCAGPAVPPAVYIPGALLGLPGPMNDVDGLIFRENGMPGYQPPTVPFSWTPGVVPIPTDMVFFSVRPGSAVVGMPDSLCGTPISPADILWPPAAPGLMPRKWIPAAQLGLLATDNIDALDLVGDCNGNGFPDNLEVKMGLAADCNGNLVPDSCDIASGTSLNINGNTIPDECECLADATGNGIVDIDDLVKVISQWGPCIGCPPVHCTGDVTWDCLVNIDDLVKVIGAWGACP